MKQLAAFLIIVSLQTAVLPAQEQDRPDPAGWSQLAKLHAGSIVRLRFANAAEVTGSLVESSGETVVLEHNTTGEVGVLLPTGSSLEAPLTFQKALVSDVTVVKRWKKPMSTAKDFAIMAGVTGAVMAVWFIAAIYGDY